MDITIEQAASADWDCCIIGSGPAGITLALELQKRDAGRILLVESGLTKPSAPHTDLSELAPGQQAHHFPMHEAVNRRVGGTSNTWGGRCLPFDPIDFETRDWVPSPDWPIAYDDIAPYFSSAGAYMSCGEAKFTLKEAAPDAPPHIVPGFRNEEITDTALERWSPPMRFWQHYREDLTASKDIHLLAGWTCTGLVREDGGIGHCILKSLEGGERKVRAGAFIIAAGGLESTRLLLANPGVFAMDGAVPDALGKYYQCHLTGKIAKVKFTTPADKTVFGFDIDKDGVYMRRRFTLSKRLQREHKLLNIAAWLDNMPIYDPAHGNAILSLAYLALRAPVLGRFLAPPSVREITTGANRKGTNRIFAHLGNIVLHPFAAIGFAVPFIWKRYFAKRQLPGFFLKSASNEYGLQYHTEQVPDAGNRAVLSNERDALGMRRLAVSFGFVDQDIDSIIRAHVLIDDWLKECGVGRLEYFPGDPRETIRTQAKDGIHQIGTTRMAASAGDGVVDANLRVFQTDNLYVCSSSVFPTSSQANPTFTIAAFACRLAEHLASKEAQ